MSCLLEKKGKLCLEYLRDLSIEEIKRDLSCYGGVGPKTVINCYLDFPCAFKLDILIALFFIFQELDWVFGSICNSKRLECLFVIPFFDRVPNFNVDAYIMLKSVSKNFLSLLAFFRREFINMYYV